MVVEGDEENKQKKMNKNVEVDPEEDSCSKTPSDESSVQLPKKFHLQQEIKL